MHRRPYGGCVLGMRRRQMWRCLHELLGLEHGGSAARGGYPCAEHAAHPSAERAAEHAAHPSAERVAEHAAHPSAERAAHPSADGVQSRRCHALLERHGLE